MILKILLINIFCSFKCSVSRNTEESLSEIIENEGIDLNNIVTSVTPLLLDVLIIITQEACLLWEDKFDMDESYLLNITRYAKKLMGLHKIELRVSYFEEWCDYNKANLRYKLDTYSYGRYLSSRGNQHDTVVIIDDISMSGFLGYATIGSICSPLSVAIVDFGKGSRFDQKTIAEVWVHEIGHNLGFPDVNNFRCECGYSYYQHCIMYGTHQKRMGIFPKTYESCLMIPLLQKLQPSSCLLTQMTKEHLLTSCGDSILDKNEECDCGSELLCHLTKASRCCDFKTCKFRSRSYQCATGQCCKNCRFRYNHACKAANGECDKARYCTGRSAHCDKKSIAKDYETCNSEKGFCLEGKCLNMHTLCRQAYNSSSVYYSPTCARYLKTLMQTTCPRPTHLQTLNNLICVKNPNICNHFVCGMGPSSYVPNIFYFDVRSQRCIIPNTIVRVGLLGSAPNYMYCGVDRDGTNNYCWKGNCKNGINGKKCRLGECNTYMSFFAERIKDDHRYESVLDMVNAKSILNDDSDRYT